MPAFPRPEGTRRRRRRPSPALPAAPPPVAPAPASRSASCWHCSSRLQPLRCITTAACASRRRSGGSWRSSPSSSGLASPTEGLTRTSGRCARAAHAPGQTARLRRQRCEGHIACPSAGPDWWALWPHWSCSACRAPASRVARPTRPRHPRPASPAPVRSRLRQGRRGSAGARRSAHAAAAGLAARPGGRVVRAPTEAAVTRFQSAARVATDGIVGPQTQQALTQREKRAAPAGSWLRAAERIAPGACAPGQVAQPGLRPGPVDGLFGPRTRRRSNASSGPWGAGERRRHRAHQAAVGRRRHRQPDQLPTTAGRAGKPDTGQTAAGGTQAPRDQADSGRTEDRTNASHDRGRHGPAQRSGDVSIPSSF